MSIFMNQSRAVPVEDNSAAIETIKREKASADPGSVGAPMSGVVVEVRVKEGQEVKKGDVLCVQSAMKVRELLILHFWCDCEVLIFRFTLDGECSLCTSVRARETCACQRG